MVQIWKRKFEWDEPLPEDIRNKWFILLQDLKQALTIEIPRSYFYNNESSTITTRKLHVFTDASQSAYGACAYLVNGDQSVIVMAKNRVSPLKEITLPRLELMGALLGARLAKHLLENIGEMDVNFWCDSQIVISWIYSTKPLKNFIANRIKEIKENVRNQQWKYCPTLDNPADQLTRGTSAEKFVQNKLWMHGPEWITNEHQWPSWHGNMTTTSLIVNEEDEEPVASLVLPAQTENTVLQASSHAANDLNRLGVVLHPP
ncbi:unnamed protein product [Mytilus edulis]|uniref:Uncharacterized protein n=1 Tax=Mytilus edulis TaxID=6550 RepID=A0A8S3TSB6_MYTED|nr:unnamed protein product [Mytilus edulis]